MGFIPHSYDDSFGRAAERFPVAPGLAVNVGTALCLVAGKLALATGTTKPTHIAMADTSKTVAGAHIEVERVSPSVIYETVLSAADADMAVGEKHTIDTTGNKITEVTTAGIVEVVSFDGTAAGDCVRVRF